MIGQQTGNDQCLASHLCEAKRITTTSASQQPKGCSSSWRSTVAARVLQEDDRFLSRCLLSHLFLARALARLARTTARTSSTCSLSTTQSPHVQLRIQLRASHQRSWHLGVVKVSLGGAIVGGEEGFVGKTDRHARQALKLLEFSSHGRRSR